jgi:hypothetical protein
MNPTSTTGSQIQPDGGRKRESVTSDSVAQGYSPPSKLAPDYEKLKCFDPVIRAKPGRVVSLFGDIGRIIAV